MWSVLFALLPCEECRSDEARLILVVQVEAAVLAHNGPKNRSLDGAKPFKHWRLRVNLVFGACAGCMCSCSIIRMRERVHRNGLRSHNPYTALH